MQIGIFGGGQEPTLDPSWQRCGEWSCTEGNGDYHCREADATYYQLRD